MEKLGRAESDDSAGRSLCLGNLLFPKGPTLLLEGYSIGQSGPGHATLFLFDGDAQARWLEVLLVGCVVGENTDSIVVAYGGRPCDVVQEMANEFA